MAEPTFRKKKQPSNNPFVRFFVPFGVRQGVLLALIAGAITTLVGLFTEYVVMLVGICVCVAAALVGLVGGVLAVSKTKGDKRNPAYKGAIETIVMMSIFVVVGAIGIIFYFV